MSIYTLETERLLLRVWKESDRDPFFKMNSNPKVMKYFPSLLSKEENDRMFDKIQEKLSRNSWGLWAVEEKSSKAFIGFTGLNIPVADFHFSPCIEIGWRLDNKYWGKGYATEAAKKCLEFSFEEINLQEVVSFTSVLNKPSEAVMKRLNMVKEDNHFFHPSIEKGHYLCEHVLYRINQKQWLRKNTYQH